MSEIEVSVRNAPRFAHVPKGVLTATTATFGARCFWALLATYAWGDGESAFASRDTLATEMGANPRSISRWRSELEDAGLLEVTERPGRTSLYTIVYPDPTLDTAVKGGGTLDTAVKTPLTKSTPEEEPLEDEQSSHGDHPSTDEDRMTSSMPVVAGAGARASAGNCGEAEAEDERHLFPVPDPVGPPPTRKPEKVNRRKVTDAEHDLADAIVAAFNEIAGTSYTPEAWKKSIVMRIREHPDLTLAQHWDIMRHFFDHPKPWWDAPAPNLVYGNTAQFERAMVPRVEKKTRGEETDEMLRRMHEQARAGEAW